MRSLPRSFYTRRTLRVAKELLGSLFIRTLNGKRLSGIIVETEAYLWNDPASHSFRGMTERNAVMFRRGGFLYVYFTYGMHFCANVVTFREGVGEAVLIRAVQPVEGIDRMIRNRNRKKRKHHLLDASSPLLTNGPAKFAQAFHLRGSESGTDLLNGDITIAHGVTLPSSAIAASPRIGIRHAVEKRWRFYIKGNAWVSRT